MNQNRFKTFQRFEFKNQIDTVCLSKQEFCNNNTDKIDMITEEMYEIDIPILTEKDSAKYECNSFPRGYHAYVNIWSPLIGETLNCKRESSNEMDKYAVATIRKDSWENESIVGHVPENISKCCSMFLTIPNTAIEVQVVGKRVNRGGGYGLEIPVIYRFFGAERLVKWLDKKISAVKKQLLHQTAKCLK